MGSAFSLLSSGPVLTVLVVSVGFAYLYHTSQMRQRSPDSLFSFPEEKPKPSSSLKKKTKKKHAVTKEVTTSAAEEDVKVPGSEPSTSSVAKSKSDEQKPTVLQFPTVIPGGYGGDTTSAVEQDTDAGAPVKPKKKKKGKSKKAVSEGAGSSGQVGEKSDADGPAETSSLGRSSSSRKRPPQLGGAGGAGLDDSEAWTRVESRRKPRPQPSDSKGPTQDTVSDAGITTSVTGNSSPVTEDEAGPDAQSETSSKENRKTLAEKLVPKPRKTGVEDMLEEPDQPSVARVLRVQPSPGEKPAPGFSWADYEDVQVAAAEDADGEDDGGWGVVKSRGRTKSERPPQTDSQPQSGSEMTKKQRQNAAKREAQKAAKVEAEAQRLATLAKHKRDLEKARISEQYSKKGGSSSASIDDKGHLVWD